MLALLMLLPALAAPTTFWDTQRPGANSFNGAPPDRAYFEAAAAAGIQWIRLTWSKWESTAHPGQKGWFLQGDPGRYTGLIEADLAILRSVADAAEQAGVKLVLVPLTLPGSVWEQHNNDTGDTRLWTDAAYHAQSAQLWRDLAAAFADHSAVVGYNLVNEPHPAKALEGDSADVVAFQQARQGTAADLNRLYATIATAIRTADPHTPIILDGESYASTQGIQVLTPLPEALGPTLYAFHFYEPWAFTSFRIHGGAWTYPSVMPLPWGAGDTQVDRSYIAAAFDQVEQWQTQHSLPDAQILLGEYGIQRRNGGAAAYLRDVRAEASERGWHHGFYAFREEVWPMMDYEYGTQMPPGTYHDNPLWRAVTGRPLSE